MSREILIGNRVRLVSLPEWLVHDLPASEQVEMRSCIGQIAVVREIDNYGYLWIGFGVTTEHDDGARYSGHSFGVPRECVELVQKP
jgi:hypothetical protein